LSAQDRFDENAVFLAPLLPVPGRSTRHLLFARA
jgi:hypothetical protein